LPPDKTTNEDPAVSDWVKKNAHPIRSLGATNFSDLRFLAPLLAGKRVVQLGESSHGTAEFSLAKTRLIKYLHEELGYDVIAFESSVYECERADRNVATLSPLELMRSCIFGVWHTAEALPLFDYIKETRRTARPLTLAGFDMQVSAPPAVQSRPSVLRALIAPLDLGYADRVYETDREFLTQRTPAYAAQNRDRFVAGYDTLATFFRKNQKAIAVANPNDPNIAIIARQTAASMVVHVRQLAASVNGVSVAAAELRDSAMASNLDFLLDELYPGKKIIVWGHNSHIRLSGRNESQKSMGSWLAARRRNELYTIGLYMYRGVSAGNNRAPGPVVSSPPGSLESILHQSPWRYSYVDFSRPQRMRGTEWMWSPLRSLYWGMTPETIVPHEAYDGVLFFDRTYLPTYR
jgi:erythromycin esterase